MMELEASQVYDNGSWTIRINNIEVWRDDGGDNYPCESHGGTALNHMEMILIHAIKTFMKTENSS